MSKSSILHQSAGTCLTRDEPLYRLVHALSSTIMKARLGKLFSFNSDSSEANVQFRKYVARGDVDKVLALFRNRNKMKKISFGARDEQGNTVYMVAIKCGQVDMLRVLTNRDVSAVTKRDAKGKFPVTAAVYQNSVEMVQILLDCGVDVECEYNGLTPLMIAAKKGFKDVVRLLIRYGASPKAMSKRGKTAADYASDPELKRFLDQCCFDSDDEKDDGGPLDDNTTLVNDTHAARILGDAALANMNSPEFFAPDKHELFSMRQLRSKGPYGDIYVAVNTVLNYECVVKKIAANTFDEINDALAEGLALSLFKDCENIIQFKDLCVHLGDYCEEGEPFMQAMEIMSSSHKLDFEDHNGFFTVQIAMHWAKGDLRALVQGRQAAAVEEQERREEEMIANGQDPYEDPIYVEPQRFTEDELVHFIGQLATALKEIHGVGLIHRDVQPRNIFLDGKKLLLGNFGASKFFEDIQTFRHAQTVVGSEHYTAGEIYTSKYTQKIDIFSLGCVIYFLVQFKDPNFSMRDAIEDVLPEMRDNCSAFIYQLVRRCWSKDEKERPSAKRILRWLEKRRVPRQKPRKVEEETLALDIPAAPPLNSDQHSKNKLPIRKKYEILHLLASGGYGGCYMARGIKDKRLYVMKRVPCPNLEDLNRALEEAVHISYLRRGKFIVGFQDFFLDHTLRREIDTSLPAENNEICENYLSVCIVMQYCEGGDLFNVLANHKASGVIIPQDMVVKWLYQTCRGLEAIHAAKTIHRDIKTGNLFLDKDQSILIGDFGVAKDTSDQQEVAFTCIGTPDYMAPELRRLRPDLFSEVEPPAHELAESGMDLNQYNEAEAKRNRGKDESRYYDNSADIYSLGIVIYEMLTLEEPSYGIPTPIPKVYHEYLQKLVPRMIHSKPHKRPKAGVICEEMLKIWPDPENPLTLRLQKEQEERQMRARGIDPLDPHAMLKVNGFDPKDIAQIKMPQSAQSTMTTDGGDPDIETQDPTETDIEVDQPDEFDEVDDFSESDSETRANGPPTLHPDLIVTPQGDDIPEERYAGLLKQSTVGRQQQIRNPAARIVPSSPIGSAHSRTSSNASHSSSVADHDDGYANGMNGSGTPRGRKKKDERERRRSRHSRHSSKASASSGRSSSPRRGDPDWQPPPPSEPRPDSLRKFENSSVSPGGSRKRSKKHRRNDSRSSRAASSPRGDRSDEHLEAAHKQAISRTPSSSYNPPVSSEDVLTRAILSDADADQMIDPHTMLNELDRSLSELDRVRSAPGENEGTDERSSRSRKNGEGRRHRRGRSVDGQKQRHRKSSSSGDSRRQRGSRKSRGDDNSQGSPNSRMLSGSTSPPADESRDGRRRRHRHSKSYGGDLDLKPRDRGDRGGVGSSAMLDRSHDYDDMPLHAKSVGGSSALAGVYEDEDFDPYAEPGASRERRRTKSSADLHY